VVDNLLVSGVADSFLARMELGIHLVDIAMGMVVDIEPQYSPFTYNFSWSFMWGDLYCLS
jgi:hypothetical protein